MEQFTKILFGEGFSLAYWLAYSILFSIGSAVYFLMKYIKRSDTGCKFSKSYWFRDNIAKIILGVFMMYIFIRVYEDIYPYLKQYAVLQHEFTQVAGMLLLGVLNQKIVGWLSKRLGLVYKKDAKAHIEAKQ